MSKLSCVFVISDKAIKLPELLAGASGLGEKICVLIAGEQRDVDLAFSHGAHSVYLFPLKKDLLFEEYADSMAKTIRAAGSAGLVLLPLDRTCRCLAAKLAAKLGIACVNDVESINTEGGMSVRHMVYGGVAFSTEKFTAPLGIVTIGSGVFEAAPPDVSKKGTAVSAEFVPPAKAVRVLEVRPSEAASVDLGKAKRVISVGRGLKGKEDLALIAQLGAALGAELGCTRPVAEAEHWMERERYIGVSGVMLKNDVFLAIGVSGQIQHMVGSTACKVIIAINKDKNAPVFKFADYGIVGDLYKVVPKMVEAFKTA
jgi:electron transfer flavoprotein alpha subunit